MFSYRTAFKRSPASSPTFFAPPTPKGLLRRRWYRRTNWSTFPVVERLNVDFYPSGKLNFVDKLPIR